jgi:hypothetical protein
MFLLELSGPYYASKYIDFSWARSFASASTAIFASDSLLETTFFFWPANVFLKRFWDDHIYITPHPYLLHGAFFVLGVTLFLFFASGLYSEKITYANK